MLYGHGLKMLKVYALEFSLELSTTRCHGSYSKAALGGVVF